MLRSWRKAPALRYLAGALVLATPAPPAPAPPAWPQAGWADRHAELAGPSQAGGAPAARPTQARGLLTSVATFVTQAGSLADPSSDDAEVAAEEVLFVVDRLLGEGDTESAVEALEAGAARLVERHGPDCPGLLPIHAQLALLRFVDGDYASALAAAQRCYSAAMRRGGEGSRDTLPHAVRYGIMLLASGDADGALPLLQHSGNQLEGLVQDLGEAASALEPGRSELSELQGMMEQLFEYAVALGEATFYHSLCRIARNGSTQHTVLREEEGLVEGLEMLKHALEADHLILGAALREHNRLVRRSLERGQKLIHIELALQNKRLHDALRAAGGLDVTTDEEE